MEISAMGVSCRLAMQMRALVGYLGHLALHPLNLHTLYVNAGPGIVPIIRLPPTLSILLFPLWELLILRGEAGAIL